MRPAKDYVKVTVWTARAALALFERNHEFGGSVSGANELRQVLEAEKKPKPKRVVKRSVKAARARKAVKRATKRQRRASVRVQVMARADGVCECGCGRTMREDGFVLRPTLDHFWGRARAESVDSCWALADGCHYLKTNNSPSRAAWLRKFLSHCLNHGYATEAAKAERELVALALSRESAEVGRGGR